MKNKITLLQKRISILLKDKNRKNILQICKECLVFWWFKKEPPFFYFGKFLYRKEITNYKDYLSSKEVDKITLSKKLHSFQYASLLRNKLAFALYMEKHKLPVPKLFSYNFKNRFYLNSESFAIRDKEGLVIFFEKLFSNLSTTSVFVKSIAEMGGTGCFLFTKGNIFAEIEKYGNYILENDCIHQEIVIQHPDINKIYKHSVNTIRFDSYIDTKGNIHLLSAFMRFGCGGHFVDNGSAGGIYLSVDLDKGILIGKSHQLMKYGGQQLTSHPDTKVIFDGYSIPYFEEAKSIVKKAVHHIPDRIIGWDIAISPTGPIIIEGNDNNSFITPDIAYGGYLSHPLFKEIMKEV